MSESMNLLLIYGTLTAVMMLIPLIPVWKAVKEKKDINPLDVNLAYSKDPHAIAEHFIALFNNDYPEDALIAGRVLNGKRLGKLSVIASVFKKSRYKNLVCTIEEIVVPPNTRFDQELMAKKTISLSSGCHAKAIYAAEALTLGNDCCVSRWIDAKDTLIIKSGSQINIASCSEIMYLEPGIAFNRIYAHPILTSHEFNFNHDISVIWQRHEVASKIDENLLYIQKEKYRIEKDENIFQSIVLSGELLMEEGAKVFGDIKANGDVILKDKCVVDGNIISEGNIDIGEGCFVTGDLFSRKEIIIRKGTQIGTETHRKSVIAKGNIQLHEHVAVFNYILTDSRGFTV